MTDLLPCPFCTFLTPSLTAGGLGRRRVICAGCGATGPPGLASGGLYRKHVAERAMSSKRRDSMNAEAAKLAIAGWNMRGGPSCTITVTPEVQSIADSYGVTTEEVLQLRRLAGLKEDT